MKTPANKFDVYAFSFTTDIDDVQAAIDKLVAKQEDPMAEKLTDQEEYWLGRWLTDMPLYRKHNQKTALLCAVENRVLGLYTGKKKTTKKAPAKKKEKK